MNAYAMRNSLELRNFNTTITRAEFEAHFTKTREERNSKHTSRRPARASASPSTAGTERATTARAETLRYTAQTFPDSKRSG